MIVVQQTFDGLDEQENLFTRLARGKTIDDILMQQRLTAENLRLEILEPSKSNVWQVTDLQRCPLPMETFQGAFGGLQIVEIVGG